MAPLTLRTGLEYAIILALIALYLSGGRLSSPSTPSAHLSTPPATVSQDRLQSLVYPDPRIDCPEHRFDVRILSSRPLVVYLGGFLREDEGAELVHLSEGLWRTSTVFNAGEEVKDRSVRRSEKAQIPRPRTIQCLERRALSFQGYPRHTSIERLWTQRYTSGGHYAPHYDWASADPSARRRSSFMVYVQANCSGGGTHFPLLQMPGDRSWCEVLDCSEAAKTRGGVTFLPIAGAAVYWENFDGEEGPGWEEGLHAGMPVESGVKIGLNIWSWYQRGFEPEQLLRQEGREEKGQS